MGKGDIKTRRGKLFRGSYGILRPRKRKVRGMPGPEMAQFNEPPKKAASPKTRSKKTVEEIKEELPPEDVRKETTDVPEPEVSVESKEKITKNELKDVKPDSKKEETPKEEEEAKTEKKAEVKAAKKVPARPAAKKTEEKPKEKERPKTAQKTKKSPTAKKAAPKKAATPQKKPTKEEPKE